MIDDISLQILKILQQKARIPNVEVARQVDMAPSAVLERIRKLEKQGIIDGYEVILNPRMFRRNLVAFIHAHISESSCAAEVGKELTCIPEIQEVHFITGKDCFLIKARVSDTAELEHIITKKISPITYITKTETSIALSTLKETSQIPLDSMDINNLT